MNMQAKDPVVRACREGLVEAYKLYGYLSGGADLGEAPESLIQAEIAKALGNICQYVTMESPVTWLLRAADAERRGRPVRNRNGRIDVVGWNEDDQPEYLIEVKKAWGPQALHNDAHRLRAMLNHGGTFQAGLMVVYTTARREATVTRRWENISTNTNSCRIISLPIAAVDPDDRNSWMWSGAVFMVR